MSYGASSYGEVSYGADVVPAAAGGNSQALVITLDSITVAINQTAQHSQSLAITLADITATVNQVANHPQSIAVTLADITASISQTLTHNQTLAITLDSIAFAANQTNTGSGKSQSLAITLDSITSSVSQTVSHNQTLAATLADVSFSAVQIGAASKSVGGYYELPKKKFVVKIDDKLIVFSKEQHAKQALELSHPKIDSVTPVKFKKPVVAVKPLQTVELVDVRAVLEKSRIDYLLTVKHLDALIKEYEDARDEQDIEDLLMMGW